ncbi:MAG: SUMF1/EgtB/PvdO family nonheme iron enzyme [Mariniphaga sp.]|nr:SUMF1/EgtB/PvdO family nonheme iron enzyme [Mariniphaga sp.]
MNNLFNYQRFSIFIINLTLIFLLSNCSNEVKTIINDGYGDYMLVPAGKFLMGDNFNDSYVDSKEESSEKPVHKVKLDAFYIGKFEVTNGEFSKFIDDGGYTNPAF